MPLGISKVDAVVKVEMFSEERILREDMLFLFSPAIISKHTTAHVVLGEAQASVSIFGVLTI